MEPATYTDTVVKGKTFDINYIEWGVIDDVDTSLDAIYHSQCTLNFMQYYNADMDALLESVKLEPDYDVRKATMMQFQELFVKELPTVNVLVRVNAYGYSKQKFGRLERHARPLRCVRRERSGQRPPDSVKLLFKPLVCGAPGNPLYRRIAGTCMYPIEIVHSRFPRNRQPRSKMGIKTGYKGYQGLRLFNPRHGLSGFSPGSLGLGRAKPVAADTGTGTARAAPGERVYLYRIA